MVTNISNPDELDDFLRHYWMFNEALRIPMEAALKTALKNDQRFTEEFEGNYLFNRHLAHMTIDHNIRHVRDWIVSAMKDKDEWLTDCNESGVPNRLLGLEKLSDVLKLADTDMGIKAKKLRAQFMVATSFDEDEQAGHTKTVYRFENGYRLVQLLTPHALKVETAHMQHCIGQGAYDHRIQSKTSYAKFFSLRCSRNKPHATIETFGNAVSQCVGKQNRPVVKKYLPYLKELADKKEWCFNTSQSQSGIIIQDDNIYSLEDLPDDFTFKGNLIFHENTWLKSLPKNLTIEGDLHLDDCANFRDVPEGLTVTGDIFFNDKTRYISEEFDSVEKFRKFMRETYPAPAQILTNGQGNRP